MASKSALTTGATRGIGAHTARLLLDRAVSAPRGGHRPQRDKEY
ncbi:hypothetical protein [Streptomyces sp. NPDC003393]